MTDFDVYENYNRMVREGTVDSYINTETVHKHICSPGFAWNFYIDFEGSNEEKRLFYEPISQLYFKSTISQVLQAEYHLNRNFALGMEVTLNDFYDLLGLPSIQGGDEKVWCFDSGYSLIDFNHRKHVTETETIYYEIEIITPYDDYN